MLGLYCYKPSIRIRTHVSTVELLYSLEPHTYMFYMTLHT